MSSETWRVVLRDGSVRDLIVNQYGARCVVSAAGVFGFTMADDPHEAASRFAAALRPAVAEILAPGEPTRAEMAAQIVAETRRADDAQTERRALAEAFTHDLRDLRLAAHAAGWDGTNATTGNMVAAIRAGALREALAIARAEPGVPEGATQADFNAVECARRIADGIEKLMGGA